MTSKGNSVSKSACVTGVADHAGWAIMVTLASDGTILDRRRVELVDSSLPALPHHNQGQWAIGRYVDAPWAKPITLKDALELIERVRTSARQHASRSLEAVAASSAQKISGIALRALPNLPAGVEERLRDNRAQTMADSVMYREALADAAESLGWSVRWYDPEQVFEQAARALGVEDLRPILEQARTRVGAPWQADHKLAMAAAIWAGRIRLPAGRQSRA